MFPHFSAFFFILFQFHHKFHFFIDFFLSFLQGYSGKSCSLHIDNNIGNEWHYLASAYSGLTPRAAHSAIYVRETDSLYVYGGHDLNNILGSLQVCKHLDKYNFIFEINKKYLLFVVDLSF